MNMKNITLTTLALSAAMFAANSQAASASAATGAEVIVPIAIAKHANADLRFGKFAQPAALGSVTISTSGERTSSGVILSAVGSSPSAAQFNVTGDGAATYSISITDDDLTIDGGGATMAFAPCSALTNANSCEGNVTAGTLSGGAQSIYVGGTLTVGASQATGVYAGTVSVAVEYN